MGYLGGGVGWGGARGNGASAPKWWQNSLGSKVNIFEKKLIFWAQQIFKILVQVQGNTKNDCVFFLKLSTFVRRTPIVIYRPGLQKTPSFPLRFATDVKY